MAKRGKTGVTGKKQGARSKEQEEKGVEALGVGAVAEKGEEKVRAKQKRKETEKESEQENTGEKEKEKGKGKRESVPRTPERPVDRKELREWVEKHVGLRLPEKGVCARHDTPLDYLEHVFFERGETGDTVVWACRGGGKTTIGALATLLDLLYKPGIQVKILGGSKEQSQRMYTYLCSMVEERFRTHVKGKVTGKGFTLKNGSKVEILTQSQTAVRGARVQKMRCDEVELFDEEVWRAAQLTTRSMREGELTPGKWRRGCKKKGGEAEGGNMGGAPMPRVVARGAVEVFSTLHRREGLMTRLVEEAGVLGGQGVKEPRGQGEVETGGQGKGGKRRVFRWCVWDVVARCPEEVRKCAGCELEGWCGGKAREGSGFVAVEDVLGLKARSSRGMWETEMLCGMPVPEEGVFPAFTSGTHVRAFGEQTGEVRVDGRRLRLERVIAGIDYGWRKFVCVWVALLRDEGDRRVAWVVDEYVQGKRDLAGHVGAIKGRVCAAGEVSAYFGDVAGRQHDAHSGETSEDVLRGAGLRVKSQAMRVEDGLRTIDALIHPPEAWQGKAVPRLLVDPRCVEMKRALMQYERKEGKVVKDGEHDHLVDALRYALVGAGRGEGKVVTRAY